MSFGRSGGTVGKGGEKGAGGTTGAARGEGEAQLLRVEVTGKARMFASERSIESGFGTML